VITITLKYSCGHETCKYKQINEPGQEDQIRYVQRPCKDCHRFKNGAASEPYDVKDNIEEMDPELEAALWRGWMMALGQDGDGEDEPPEETI